MSAFAGLALAALVAGVVVAARTGWPLYAVLLAVACAVAGTGWAVGVIDAALLGALPARLVGILEHDLLQAIALYAFVGALMRQTRLAEELLHGFESLATALRVPAASRPALAGFAFGLLTAPMNGSAGASTALLGRTVLPRWQAAGVPAARAQALAAVAATVGVVVPPSLVLLLSADALLRAHTEGLRIGGHTQVRVINTQDLIQACLPAAIGLALLWAVLAAVCARTRALQPGPQDAAPRSAGSAWLVMLGVVLMLAAVAGGVLRAVEGAAAVALGLAAHAWARGELAGGRLRLVLDDAMALTGALFALLVAASTLSLVLRASGCDRLVESLLATAAGHPQQATLYVMAVLLLAACVLDAFEIVFLVVPIVMPPLLAQVPDAAWVGCLMLIVLQAGFLAPPLGYAVALVRQASPPEAGAGGWELARALVPYLGALAAVFAVVFACPSITGWLRTTPAQLSAPAPAEAGSVEDLMRSMGAPRRGGGDP